MRRAILTLLGAFFVGTSGTHADESLMDSAGLRTGISTHRPCDRFYQTEIYGIRHLPWTAELTSRWALKSRLESTAGFLSGRHEAGFIVSLGPSLSLERKDRLFSLIAGVSPTLMDRQTFGNKPFGSNIQFTSHIGGSIRLSPRTELGIRFQHMSNAGINADHNPGVNNFMCSVGYLF